MAKTKADYIAEAEALGLEVSEKNTIKELQTLIEGAATEAAPPEAEAPASEETTDEATEEAAEQTEESFAKSGKRSKKAADEAAAEAEKEARKEAVAAGEIDPSAEGAVKGPAPKTRSRLERRSKAYRSAFEAIDQNKDYAMDEAAAAAIAASTVKFDASVELHVNLNVDPRQADQNIRTTVDLPNGNGKTVRVAVFAPADKHAEAKEAGADIVGEDDFLELLKKEEINFDRLVATPEVMGKLGRFARLLGPKGLMPNPKSGTVTKDVAKAVKDAKGGQVEFRVDAQGIVHIGIGKVSFGADKVTENAEAVLEAIRAVKPNSIKGNYITAIHVTTTMGPSVAVRA